MNIFNIFILAFKNIKAFFKMKSALGFLFVCSYLQLTILQNVYENFVGLNIGKINGFTKIISLDMKWDFDPLQFFSASALVQFIYLMGILATSLLVSEKENHTLLRIITSPVNKLHIILGNLIGYIFSMFLMSLVFIGVTHYLLGVDWGDSIPAIGIVTLVIIFSSVSLSMLAATMFKNTKVAAGIMSFIIVTMVFVSGAITANMQYNKVSIFTLNKWGFNAYMDIMNGKPLPETAINLIVLALFGVVLLFANFIVFGREKNIE